MAVFLAITVFRSTVTLPPIRTPYSSARLATWATYALATIALVGMHPVLTQVPPNRWRSTTATDIPASVRRFASGGPAWPAPMTIASYFLPLFTILILCANSMPRSMCDLPDGSTLNPLTGRWRMLVEAESSVSARAARSCVSHDRARPRIRHRGRHHWLGDSVHGATQSNPAVPEYRRNRLRAASGFDCDNGPRRERPLSASVF